MDPMLVLLYLLASPLIIDLGAVLLAVYWRGKRFLLCALVVAWVGLNLFLPILIVLNYFSEEVVWGLALIGMMKTLEFLGFRIADTFWNMWLEDNPARNPTRQ